jgi:plastin-3
LETLGGMSDSSAAGTTHSVRLEEQLAFSDWINSNLSHDQDLRHLLPIDPEGKMLYDKNKDGILLCKIINHSCPDTIDERAINKKNLTVYTKFENLTLALVSSQAIGCNIVNIDAHDLAKGKPHLVLGLLWQIIRIGLFSHITLDSCPGLATLLGEGERLEDLMKLSPEAILLRWVNHHLAKAGVQRRCANFQSDIADSEVYTYLLKQIAPNDASVTLEALRDPNMVNRAETMLQQAAKLNCRSFVTPQDVVNGVYKLNLAFVANLFNNHPGLDQPEQIEGLESIEETREEKSEFKTRPFIFRNVVLTSCLFFSIPQLDELDGCKAARQLAVLRSGRWSGHLPTVRRYQTGNCELAASTSTIYTTTKIHGET